MTTPDRSLDPDPQLPVSPTAATHAYWLMPGAVVLGSDPERDRLIGTVALGPAPDVNFYEQVEMYDPGLAQAYTRIEHSVQPRRNIGKWMVRGASASFSIVCAATILTFVVQTLVPSRTAIPFPFTILIVAATIAVLMLGWTLLSNWNLAAPSTAEMLMPEGEPVDVHALIRARITPLPEIMEREVPLLTCHVCRAARLACDQSNGMTVCPNCGTELPLYQWPIEVPAPDEPLLGIS